MIIFMILTSIISVSINNIKNKSKMFKKDRYKISISLQKEFQWKKSIIQIIDVEMHVLVN